MPAGPRPSLREIFPIALPRPRDRTDPELLKIYRRIQEILAEEVQRSRAE
ncbi:MAG: hypothetical protein OXH64_06105 [Rhodospirillaceae bacterium]|nr:hypothetical protein [Rhodospirillaceae bacterium]